MHPVSKANTLFNLLKNGNNSLSSSMWTFSSRPMCNYNPTYSLFNPTLRTNTWSKIPTTSKYYGSRSLLKYHIAPVQFISKYETRKNNLYQRKSLCCYATQAADSSVEDTESAASASQSYDASQIQVLKGLEPVRKRPGMYIGSTGMRGLHQLLYEVVDNAIDEVQGGHASRILVEVQADGWVSVQDDGRGIPTQTHPHTGKSALETVLTVLHAGGKFGGESSGYSVSGGLHGVGVSVVNALSQECKVQVWREGRVHSQSFSRGAAITELETEAAAAGAPATGTRVSFLPDPQIFSKVEMDMGVISSRLRELAFLNSKVHITLQRPTGKQGGEPPKPEDFHFSGGLVEYIHYLNRGSEALHADPVSLEREGDGGVRVQAAMQWCQDSFQDTILGYANSIRTVDGGMHLDGLKIAVTRTINSLARKYNLAKDSEPNFTGAHVREGFSCVVSVQVPNPEFEGQTKTRLGNPEVRKIVESAVSEALSDWLERQPEVLSSVVLKAQSAMRAAEAAKRARELVRRKSSLVPSTLPGKLADCTSKDQDETEIFIVEGESAGGSAKQARDRMFQAILPLRGKILNVERIDDANLYKNSQISDMIIALGLGIRGEFKPAKLRYGKIIILTDADVDGAHIRTLLLTFLFRYQKDLFSRGHVFVGVPPLYKVDVGRKSKYLYSDNELNAFKAKLEGENKSYNIQRFKGLGEMMPQQLWDTTMDPDKRHLRRLTIDDAGQANATVQMLMSKEVGPRRAYIDEFGPALQELDI